MSNSDTSAKSLYHDLSPYLSAMRPYWVLLLCGLLLNLMAVASSIGLVTLSSWFLNASALAGLALTSAQAFNYALPSAGVRMFATTRTLTRYGERTITHEATFKLLSQLRKQVYLAIEPLSPTALQHIGSSELSTRLTADVDALDTLYVRVLVPSLVAMLSVIGYGIMIGIFAPVIGTFSIIILALTGILGPWIAWKRGHESSARWQQLNSELHSRLLERLDGFAELSLYGHWEKECQQLLNSQYERDNAQLALARQWGDAQLISMILLGLGVAGSILLAAWWSTHHGLDPTMIATIGLGVLAAFEAVMLLPQAWQQLGKVRRAASRLNQLRDMVPTIHFPSTESAKPTDTCITIEHVSLSHDGIHQVLDNLTLTLESGEHLALIGRSGSGKTSLLNLLIRFVTPTSGSLKIGSVPIEQFSEAQLRKLFAVTPQDIHIFSANYRDNLRMGNSHLGDDEIIAMLQALQLGDWLEHQPEGLDSWPEEGGSSLSGGQLRRFGIARALLSKAPIVLLDEPSEGLDHVTQEAVMSHIKTCCKGRSLLIITHRLNDLDYVDRYAYLDQGKIQASIRVEDNARAKRHLQSLYHTLHI